MQLKVYAKERKKQEEGIWMKETLKNKQVEKFLLFFPTLSLSSQILFLPFLCIIVPLWLIYQRTLLKYNDSSDEQVVLSQVYKTRAMDGNRYHSSGVGQIES